MTQTWQVFSKRPRAQLLWRSRNYCKIISAEAVTDCAEMVGSSDQLGSLIESPVMRTITNGQIEQYLLLENAPNRSTSMRTYRWGIDSAPSLQEHFLSIKWASL
jgi:hypothetical protein